MKEDQKIVIYQTPDGKTQIDVRLEDETGSRGDRYLSHSSRHTQIPVPATKDPDCCK